MSANTPTDSSINSKADAIEAFRNMRSAGAVSVDRAAALAEPWGVADEIQDWRDDLDDEFPNKNHDSMGVPLVLSMVVGHGTDQTPHSGDEYYFGNAARGIGGHKKADRGKFKGNLAILEQDAGMNMTYGLYDDTQNGTDPCPDCGRTCLYAQSDGPHLECANCGHIRER